MAWCTACTKIFHVALLLELLVFFGLLCLYLSSETWVLVQWCVCDLQCCQGFFRCYIFKGHSFPPMLQHDTRTELWKENGKQQSNIFHFNIFDSCFILRPNKSTNDGISIWIKMWQLFWGNLASQLLFCKFSCLRGSVNIWIPPFRGRMRVTCTFLNLLPYKCKTRPLCSKKLKTSPRSSWNLGHIYKCRDKMVLLPNSVQISQHLCPLQSLAFLALAVCLYGGGCHQRSRLGSLEPEREQPRFIFSALPFASAAATFQKGRFNGLLGGGGIFSQILRMHFDSFKSWRWLKSLFIIFFFFPLNPG